MQSVKNAIVHTPPPFPSVLPFLYIPKNATIFLLLGGDVCGTLLLRKAADSNNEASVSKPKKTFVYHHFHDYLAGLLSRKDIESLMDESCDTLSSSINVVIQPLNM